LSFIETRAAMFACLGLVLLKCTLLGGCRIGETAGSEGARVDAAINDRNAAALSKADTNIEKYRKGAVRIKVVDSRGRPLANTHLEIKQVSHAFKFGCYLKIDDLSDEKLANYERKFKTLFNYAVVGVYWDRIENKRGVEDWSWFDREVALGRRLGLEIQAAPVLWGTSEFGAPRWLPGKANDLTPILERRVRSSVTRNAAVADWEIVNEPLARNEDFFAKVAGHAYIDNAFASAKDAAPSMRFMINEYGVFGSVAEHNYNRDHYHDLLEQMIKQDAAIDVIGIQAHTNGEWFEPANVAEQLDKYAGLGKPLQITELSAQTLDLNDRRSTLPISGKYRVGVWDPEKQADFYREFYTIAFGSRGVEAIVTWGLDDERAWLPGIGLIDEKGNAKPVYQTLDKLLNEQWKTTLRGNTSERGIYEFRGFYGDYEVEVISPARKKAGFVLRKDSVNDWTLRLDN
jgi:GH35 family endo-1,4-beta-xylanase